MTQHIGNIFKSGTGIHHLAGDCVSKKMCAAPGLRGKASLY
jgi:hypothetical protein